MALFEFKCQKCQARFEQIRSSSEREPVRCAKCGSENVEKLISAFKVGGQGDLRESTMHGCHDCYTGGPGESSSRHDHAHEGHGHDSE